MQICKDSWMKMRKKKVHSTPISSRVHVGTSAHVHMHLHT